MALPALCPPPSKPSVVPSHLRGSVVRGPPLRRLRHLRRRLNMLPAATRSALVLLVLTAAAIAVAFGGGRFVGVLMGLSGRGLLVEVREEDLYVSSGTFRVEGARPAGKVLTVPEGYGPGREVIENVLANVTEFIAGGMDVDWEEMAASADGRHMHGKWIGTRKAEGGGVEEMEELWRPTPFDFEKETEAMKRVAHTKTLFNKRRSDSLPLHRDIPDVRPMLCRKQWYYRKSALPGIRGSTEHVHGKTTLNGKRPEILSATGGPASVNGTVDTDKLVLPDTSVVFVMINEPLSTLLRSVYSVLDRTPPQLLREIVIVDDGSDAEEAPWLAPGGEFEKHIGYLPKVKLARLRGRNGLMRARNVGIALATGTTFTVLDSHIEVNEGWLEPLMGRVAEGYAEGVNRVVVPTIDSIEADNFNYRAGGIDILGHTWSLGQEGVFRAKSAAGTSPVASPIMAGGLLALDRKWFNDLGYYDPLMRLWGGEETEISFRIWQCGGTLECHPCSRVGHIFRSFKHWQGQVYKIPGYEVTRNKLRTASVWMDEYADLVKLASAPLPEGTEIGNLDYMKGIRNRLQCKSYSWYLENVFPELLPSGERVLGQMGSGTLKANGFLRSTNTRTCVDTLMRKRDGENVGVYPCHGLRGTQAYVAADDDTIVIAELSYSSCITRSNNFAAPNASEPVKIIKCQSGNRMQHWVSHSKDNKPAWIYEKESEGLEVGAPKGCLTVVHSPETENKSSYTLRTQACVAGNPDQMWEWETVRSPKLLHSKLSK